MDSREHLTQTLEYFRQQKEAKLQEILRLDVMIHDLERELGETPSNAITLDLTSPSVSGYVPNSGVPTASMRPDEFFGMSQTDAARAYLKKIGRATSLEQILEGMKRGGAHVGGADPKNTLYVSLMRNPKQEFIKVGDGFIGLREFYPNLPKASKSVPKKAHKGGRRKGVKNNSKRTRDTSSGASEKHDKKGEGEANPEIPQDPPIGRDEIKDEIRKVLSDHLPHPLIAIQSAVGQKFGNSVSPAKILGYLRSHEFENDEIGYRLKR
jgi:hypothetical protein